MVVKQPLNVDFSQKDVFSDSPLFRSNLGKYDDRAKKLKNKMKYMSKHGQGVAASLSAHGIHLDDFSKLLQNMEGAQFEDGAFKEVSGFLEHISQNEKDLAEDLMKMFGDAKFKQYAKNEAQLSQANKVYETSSKDLESNSYNFFKEKKDKPMTLEEVNVASNVLNLSRFRDQVCNAKYAQIVHDNHTLIEIDVIDYCVQYVSYMIQLHEQMSGIYAKLQPIIKKLQKEMEIRLEERDEDTKYFSSMLQNHTPEGLLDGNSEFNKLEKDNCEKGLMSGYIHRHSHPSQGSIMYEGPYSPSSKRISTGDSKGLYQYGLKDLVCEYIAVTPDGTMHIYNENAKIKEKVNLTDCMVNDKFAMREDGRIERCYGFELHTTKNSYYFQVNTTSELENWAIALRKHTKYKEAPTSREEVQEMQNDGVSVEKKGDSQLTGKLTIQLHSVAGLSRKEIDCHAIISVGQQQIKTEKKNKTKHPTWNSQYCFDIITRKAELEIAFFDTSQFRKNHIGIAYIDISNLPKDTTLKTTFPVLNEKRITCGEVIVTMHYSQVKTGKITVNDFDLLSVIGKGSYGKVIQARKKDTKQLYAIKIVKKIDALNVSDTQTMENIKRERDVMAKINFPFLMNLQFAFQSETKLYYVLNFVNGGELYFHLLKAKKFEPYRAKFYAAEIMLALEYLHNIDIIYRDLKAENILLDFYGHVCLIDFGLCKQQKEGETNTLCGTPDYVAPEVFEQKYGKEIDWWSFGVLLWEMSFSKPPFHHPDVNEVFKGILTKDLVAELDMLEELNNFPEHLRRILLKLLQRNPAKRLGHNGAQEIKDDPYFKEIDFEALVKKEIVPPFRPKVESEDDTRNFDQKLMNINPRDTLEVSSLSSEQQSLFRGFTFSLDQRTSSALQENIQSMMNSNTDNFSESILEEEVGTTEYEPSSPPRDRALSDTSFGNHVSYSSYIPANPSIPSRPARAPPANPVPSATAPPRPAKPSPIL